MIMVICSLIRIFISVLDTFAFHRAWRPESQVTIPKVNVEKAIISMSSALSEAMIQLDHPDPPVAEIPLWRLSIQMEQNFLWCAGQRLCDQPSDPPHHPAARYIIEIR